MKNRSLLTWVKSLAAQGGIIVFFIMAFEVMIMISPFAFFFYSVFNPVLHQLGSHMATRWMTDFFLPHMILPPTLFLKTIRILGSGLFIIGSVTFVICALQVYLGKIFKWGIASRGLYRVIRHPQYLALSLWGIGMTILWPRFLVLVTLSIMFILYYFLAKDEERRMLSRYGESYHRYIEQTGMFLPRPFENWIPDLFSGTGNHLLKYAVIILGIPLIVIGSGFLLRAITMHSLLFESGRNITLVSILPEDDGMSNKIINDISAGGRTIARLSFLQPGKDYLGYVMPPDYIMQGMIADTGDEFHLHKQQHTFALITDWVLNPFEHLRRSPSAVMAKMYGVDPAMARRHHCPLAINDESIQCGTCPYRRVVFIEIDHDGKGHFSQKSLFSFDAERVPVCFIDINALTGEIVNIRKVQKATAWKDVPTPTI